MMIEGVQEQTKILKKQLFYERVRTLAALVTAGGIIFCMVTVVPVVLSTAKRANDVMLQASETIVLADAAIESITEMSNTITSMGDNMDTFITENSKSVEEVMKKVEAVDFEGLNKAIKDLGDVVEPFANFFGKFK